MLSVSSGGIKGVCMCVGGWGGGGIQMEFACEP